MLIVQMEKEFKESLTSSETNVQRNLEEWSPPPRNCYKLNVNASYAATIGEAGLGIAMRNEDALVCLCCDKG